MNPYRSPQPVRPDTPTPSNPEDEFLRKRGPIVRLFLGALAGILFGVMTAGVFSILLGAAFAVTHWEIVRSARTDRFELLWHREMARDYLQEGVKLGIFCGGLIGALSGLISGATKSRSEVQRMPVWPFAATGLLTGVIGGMAVTGFGIEDARTACVIWIPVGALLGASLTTLAGKGFHRVLGRISWGQRDGIANSGEAAPGNDLIQETRASDET